MTWFILENWFVVTVNNSDKIEKYKEVDKNH